MIRATRFVSAVGTVMLALGLVLGMGCREEGPMERAGASIDEKIEEVSDKLGGHESDFDKLGEKLDEAVDRVREKIEEAEESAEGN